MEYVNKKFDFSTTPKKEWDRIGILYDKTILLVDINYTENKFELTHSKIPILAESVSDLKKNFKKYIDNIKQ